MDATTVQSTATTTMANPTVPAVPATTIISVPPIHTH
jgi:hypothetical protein